MNTWPRKSLVFMLIVLATTSVAISSSAAREVVDSDTAEVGLVVVSAQEPETATVTPTPTGAAVAVATDAVGGSSSTVPVVAQLPETGVAPSNSASAPVLMTLLTAGFLLMVAGVLSSRAECKRSVSR